MVYNSLDLNIDEHAKNINEATESTQNSESIQNIEDIINTDKIKPYLLIGFIWLFGFMINFFVDFVLKL